MYKHIEYKWKSINIKMQFSAFVLMFKTIDILSVTIDGKVSQCNYEALKVYFMI